MAGGTARAAGRGGFGLVSGCQMAHVTALAAARHGVLSRVGWDVGERGLIGAPAVRVLAGAERHITVDRALRLLGFGTACITAIDADEQGRMCPARCVTRSPAGRDRRSVRAGR